MTKSQVIEKTTEETKLIRTVITESLFGEISAEESIAKLSDLLFPEENLKQEIQELKVIKDISKALAPFETQGIVIDSIEKNKKEDSFTLHLFYTDINDFIATQSKVISLLKQIANHYKATIVPRFLISQIIQP